MSQEKIKRNWHTLRRIVEYAPAVHADAERCIIHRDQVLSILDEIAVCLCALENEHKKHCEDCSLQPTCTASIPITIRASMEELMEELNKP